MSGTSIIAKISMSLIKANSAEPDEMQHNAAFHRGLHFLPKYPFWEGLKILHQLKQIKYNVRFPKLYTFTVAFEFIFSGGKHLITATLPKYMSIFS